MTGVRIDNLTASLTPSLDHEFPAMLNGVTEKLTIQQIADLVLAIVVDDSPEALNTLNELSAALNDDENFATNITSLINQRLKLDGSSVMTGPLNLGGEDLQNVSNLVGMSAFFYSSSPPAGWLKSNGALLSRTTYSALWNYAQSSGMIVTDTIWNSSLADQGKFSEGDGSTTFRIPDARARVVRAWDDGKGIDSDRVLGSLQEDLIKNHSHSIGYKDSWAPFGQTFHTETGYINRTFDANVRNMSASSPPVKSTLDAEEHGVETRVKNIALLACIKY